MQLGYPVIKSIDGGVRQLSWRDPDGFVLEQDGRIFRAVTPERSACVERLLGSSWFERRMESGSIPRTWWASRKTIRHPGADQFRWLEHERLPFPCYPHEVSALQLYDAASLTLDLAREAHEHGWLLKDASAWNVLFDSGRPVFCDALSFLPHDSSATWAAYGQFQRNFIIPLLLHRYLGLSPSALFLAQRDGVRPEDAIRMLKGMVRWRQPALEAVTLPALLARRRPDSSPQFAVRKVRQVDAALASRLFQHVLRRLSRHLEKLQPSRKSGSSLWSRYEAERDHYTQADIEHKRLFVHQTMVDPRIRTVLDLGCNTGEFSFLAESTGKQVVAADNDEPSLHQLYSRIRQRGSSIQPLRLDLGRPTPAVGWMGAETPGILNRMAARFDCVLMLGLMHHMLISERVPIGRICELLAALQPTILVVEWVERHDARFRELAGSNAELYASVDRRQFEAEIVKRFKILETQTLPSQTRALYRCERSA